MVDRSDLARVSVTEGFDSAERELVARLFWEAFAAKLWTVLAPEDKAIRFLAQVLQPRFALAARAPDGRLLGLAGIKTGAGGLVGGGLRDLAAVYGWPGALWRGALLSLFEREVSADSLLMDGIFVAADVRGRGVGTALLDAVKARARREGRRFVRLDVIDSNPRARALYEREGFVAVGETRLGPLRHVFGFRASIEMRCAV